VWQRDIDRVLLGECLPCVASRFIETVVGGMEWEYWRDVRLSVE
jgi:hypothetical protein